MKDINNQLLNSVLDNLKIEELNEMQKAAYRESLKDNNLVLLSPTGSGKTLAFLLPLLNYLKQGVDGVQALILAPSRELALQIESVFKQMGSDRKCCCCYGGHSMSEEKRSLINAHPDVVIGTPGRILDHLDKGNLEPSTIETLIIDEFDKSLEFGFHDQMADIVSRLPNLNRRILLSATDAEEIPQFTGIENVVKLNFLTEDSSLSERITLMKVDSPAKAKLDTHYNH